MKAQLFLALSLAAMALIVGCASRPAYYVAPAPPPPQVYQQSIVQVAESNGFADGRRHGERDHFEGHSYRPTSNDQYAHAPGYYPQLGGNPDQYRYYYRDGFMRGYNFGYTRG
jgi:hypothetical protein